MTAAVALTAAIPTGRGSAPAGRVRGGGAGGGADADLEHRFEMMALDRQTGKTLSAFKASPVGANGKAYLATEEGDVVVVRMGNQLEVLATNTLADQSFIASPVIVNGAIYLRSRTHLFRIN